jgi:hypothetical protein
MDEMKRKTSHQRFVESLEEETQRMQHVGISTAQQITEPRKGTSRLPNADEQAGDRG